MSLSSPNPGWTDARVESLTTLWRSGLSARQIAGSLGGVTRNAVIGKLHRLGLSGRAKPSAPRRPRPPRALSPRSRARIGLVAPRVAPAAPSAPTPEGPGLVRALPSLTAHACHWPIGDPKASDFSFCGRPTIGARPYCADHDRRAHRPGAEPLDRDPILRRLLAGDAA